jgi:hypothetical protein
MQQNMLFILNKIITNFWTIKQILLFTGDLSYLPVSSLIGATPTMNIIHALLDIPGIYICKYFSVPYYILKSLYVHSLLLLLLTKLEHQVAL